MDVAALYREHHGSLVRYLERVSGDAELARDAAQETFLRIQQSPPADERNLRSWLFRVATNVVRDARRARTRRRRLLRGAPERAPLADAPLDPARAAEIGDLRTRVRSALGRLREKERTALLMREEGFRHSDIAAAIGTTTKSVGTIIARALDKLARELPLDSRSEP